MTKKLFAPQIDNLIEAASRHPEALDEATKSQVLLLFEKIKAIEICGGDERRELWLRAERGSIEDFGDYEDYLEYGEVENREEFENLWKMYYPEPIKWYKLISVSYNNVHSIGFGDELVFRVGEDIEIKYGRDYSELAVWLNEAIEQAIGQLRAGEYNRIIAEGLPYQKRLGKILRNDFWHISPEHKKSHLGDMADDEIQAFVGQVKKQPAESPHERLPQMTAGNFFEYCKIGYVANKYKNSDFLPTKDLYKKNADGRHDGLLDLDEDSAEAFFDWVHDKQFRGGHPWEVCRGGNSTHISLYAHHDDGGWHLSLAGFSWIRSVETVRFYMALVAKGVPVFLYDGAELAEMLTGADYIGIVPENVKPAYCGSMFPEKILDFMNLPFEDTEAIIEAAQWYPIPQIKLANK
jgi:hypothetical protein